MAFTFCTSGAIVLKAGYGVNTTAAASGAILQDFSDKAEGMINGLTAYDWIGNYTNLTTNYKGLLSNACACCAGNMLIAYDLSNYPSTTKAQTTMSFNDDQFQQCINALKSGDIKIKMNAG